MARGKAKRGEDSGKSGASESRAQDGPVPRRRYWVGCDADGPYHSYTLGGICFPRKSESVQDGQAGSVRIPRVGAIAFLTDAQVEAVHKAAHREVVRREGRERFRVLDAARRDYLERAGDYPIGCHVFMVELPEGDPPSSGSIPERLIASADDWKRPERDPDPALQAEQERARLQAEAMRVVMAEVVAAAK